MSTPGIRYYVPSGRVAWHAPLRVLLVGGFLAVLLAAVYAVVIRYNPLVYFSFIATGLFAVVLGAVAAMCCKSGHSRSTPFNLLAGLVLGVFGLWFHWLVWVALIYQPGIETAAHLARSGIEGWMNFLQFNAEHVKVTFGRLGSRGGEVSAGTMQWVWGIEAAVVVAGATLTAALGNGLDAYSERSKRWARTDWDGEFVLDDATAQDSPALKNEIEQQGIAALMKRPIAAPRTADADSSPWHTLKLTCLSEPDDPDFCLVNVCVVTYKPKASKNTVKVSRKESLVLQRLMVERGAYRRLLAYLASEDAAREPGDPTPAPVAAGA